MSTIQQLNFRSSDMGHSIITMLSRALKIHNILYRRHPEGISIKSLADHKEELMVLYARVSGKTELTDKQKESVERLCDPTDNSINEKLSRIRKSFCAEVHESVADSYVVKGSRGEERYISLDEELMELGDWGSKLKIKN